MAGPLLQENFRLESVAVKRADPNNPNNKILTYLDKSSVIQFEYREGLVDKFLKVTLQIADSNNSLSDQLVGMEEFQLVFNDLAHNVKYEFTEDSTNGPLYVFQIHDKIIADTTKILVLELCRVDAIKAMQERVCKKYTSVKAVKLVDDILKKVLGTKKQCNVTESSNGLTFIPPQSRPYDVLVWCRNKYIGTDQKTVASGGEYTSAGYFFWETYSSYNFKSVDSIAGQTTEKQIYTTGSGVGGEDEYYKIRDPSFPKTVDMMTDFNRGFYSGKIEFFDTVSCEIIEKDYTLKDNFPKWTKVGKNSTLPSLYSDVLNQKPTRTLALSYNDDLFLEPGSEVNTNSKMLFKETVTQSVQRMGVFTSQIMQGRVYGNMGLNAGDIVSVEFLDADGRVDRNYSGRYVIFDLLHIYSSGSEVKLKTDLTLVRDSFGV